MNYHILLKNWNYGITQMILKSYQIILMMSKKAPAEKVSKEKDKTLENKSKTQMKGKKKKAKQKANRR